MKDRTGEWIREQIKSFRVTWNQAPALPLSEWLTAEMVARILEEVKFAGRDRVYTPLVTLWVFLSQVLSVDHSCREAVARLMTHRQSCGAGPGSPDASPYCQARQKLPEELFSRLVRGTGQTLHDSVPQAWRFHGKQPKVVDGTTVSMPDTPANQREYPQARTQKPGLGFPIARLVAVMSLASGAVLDMAIGPYKGKQTGENALFRTLWDRLTPDDVMLADRYYCSYADIARLQQRRVAVVFRKHQLRHSDFRRGQRLGPDDHLITWSKPKQCPDWMSPSEWQTLPEQITLREVRFVITRPGKRAKEVILITTLLDSAEVPRQDLVDLYERRWDIELNLRSLKSVMQMDVLRTKTPEMVRKEVWTHLLAYNLIRTAMAKAAEEHDLLPTQISFKGTLQTLAAYRDLLFHGPLTADWFEQMMRAIASHVVGNRPDRYEPRAIKRRPKPHPLLQVPRDVARKRLPQKTYD